ncbi:MAG: hypothetical protein FJY07_11760 [Bacteroidetes bacterium]|nr:hypothetical protein [Bacteroidota bacterium]
MKEEYPVLTNGNLGEWDCEFLFPSSVIKLKDNTYRMYYSGGSDFFNRKNIYLGLAASADGKNWKKYNDPNTKRHPFVESDPVLMTGRDGEWDQTEIFTACVRFTSHAYEMYYMGISIKNQIEIAPIGFAFSRDGIHWKKYKNNPVYHLQNDPYSGTVIKRRSKDGKNVLTSYMTEGPGLVFTDTICYMYYDYGAVIGEIGMARAVLK